MKIIGRSNVKDEDKLTAVKIINRLKSGDRVFGNVAEGLKDTLSKIEKAHDEEIKNMGKLDFSINDNEYKAQVAQINAGIKGEEMLAEYIEKIIKYDKELSDIICFASLSDPEQDSGNGEYISDSDFVCVYGNSILILDAKNIYSNPEIPIYIDHSISGNGYSLLMAGGKELIEIHPSTHVWLNIMNKNGINPDSISGITVICNKAGALIWKNNVWYSCQCSPIHISELVEYLHNWVKDLEPNIDINMLVAISNAQIKKEAVAFNIDAISKKFGI